MVLQSIFFWAFGSFLLIGFCHSKSDRQDRSYFYTVPYYEIPLVPYMTQDYFSGRFGMMNPIQELVQNKRNKMMMKICSECPERPTPSGEPITDLDLVELLCEGLQYTDDNFLFCKINMKPVCLVRVSKDATYPAARGACKELSTDKAHFTLLTRETLGKLEDFETTCKTTLTEVFVENGLKENRHKDCPRVNSTPVQDIDVPCNTYHNAICEVVFYNY